MKKPINKWAVAVWVVAAAYFAGAVVDISGSTYPPDLGYFPIVWLFLRSHSFVLIQLVAVGVLIELVDKIRWIILAPEDRAKEVAHRPLWSYLKRWPHQDIP